jgi:plasmid stabilization system protein ParE
MSKRAYDFSATARLDLLQIWLHLAETASLQVADRVAAEIESALIESCKIQG